MTLESIWALIVFAFISSVTPGPNNLMLMASGLNFGLRATLPHMFGVSVGFGVMLMLVGLGLAQAFNAYPILYQILQVLGVAYLLYLAWAIAHAGAPEEKAAGAKPMSFLGACAFQWINPKAWVMAITTFTTYTPQHAPFLAIVMAVCAFTLTNLPSVSLWAIFGANMRRFLQDARKRRWFNWGMAVALIATLVPMLKF